ncbi:hypothetical protein [Weeksella sp. HMSC059D05]|uniref:hypothetical protein n=1 Tax=Weeksella sp. HMSC059D05 TaxID=1715139 RepID=UPI0008A48283|nr:hypothetical protein [Weeksella sp. HMSC059D05]OFM84648.1 hypothetical protein HMPREF2660_08125 [Weeksella sp. HMSC059D05]
MNKYILSLIVVVIVSTFIYLFQNSLNKRTEIKKVNNLIEGFELKVAYKNENRAYSLFLVENNTKINDYLLKLSSKEAFKKPVLNQYGIVKIIIPTNKLYKTVNISDTIIKLEKSNKCYVKKNGKLIKLNCFKDFQNIQNLNW